MGVRATTVIIDCDCCKNNTVKGVPVVIRLPSVEMLVAGIDVKVEIRADFLGWEFFAGSWYCPECKSKKAS